MATPTKEAPAAGQLARDGCGVSESASLEVFVFEDDGGGYHWAIVGGSGKSLARSGSFGSYEEAAHAGSYVRDGAESARFERRAAKDRDPCETAASDDLDVGRWLDEGGSFRS
jgi:hypothetical protein